MGKYQTTYWQVRLLRTLWTLLGILALAFLMTPRFLPIGLDGATEISQTVSDSQANVKAGKPTAKPQEKHSFWVQIQKILQVRSNSEHSHAQAKRL